jgi:hypothetical protein
MFTQYEYDTYLDRIQLGGGKDLVNTCDKASKQAESDKIGHDPLQNFWKMAVEDFDKRKAKKSESVTEEPKERFLQCDYEWRGNLNDHNSHGDKVKKEVESTNTEPGEPGVKVETDDVFFKREIEEKQSTPQSRPRLSGYIEETSIYHGFHYYISVVTVEVYPYFRELRLKSQTWMGLTKIFNESGTPHTVQIDGEGALANEVVADWFVSRQVHVEKTESGQHFRNGHVECRHRIWKGMSRTMIDRAGFIIDWWFLVFKHVVLITNIILLESVEPDSSKTKGIERRRSVWESHFGEEACLESSQTVTTFSQPHTR